METFRFIFSKDYWYLKCNVLLTFRIFKTYILWRSFMRASIGNIWPASEHAPLFFKKKFRNADHVLPYCSSFSFPPSYLLSKTLSDLQNTQRCIKMSRPKRKCSWWSTLASEAAKLWASPPPPTQSFTPSHPNLFWYFWVLLRAWPMCQRALLWALFSGALPSLVTVRVPFLL